MQALAPFSEMLEPQHIREDILPAFVDLTRDDQDSVRLIAGNHASLLHLHLLSLADENLSLLCCAATCSGGSGGAGKGAAAGGGGKPCDASSGAVFPGQVLARAVQRGAAGTVFVAHACVVSGAATVWLWHGSSPSFHHACSCQPLRKHWGLRLQAQSCCRSTYSCSGATNALGWHTASVQLAVRRASMPLHTRHYNCDLRALCAETMNPKCAQQQPANCRHSPGSSLWLTSPARCAG